MATNASIKIVSSIPFRGGQKEWSNRWYFNGDAPGDASVWEVFADNIVDLQKVCFNPYVHIEEAIGYQEDSDVPDFSKSYGHLACTGSFSGDVQAPEVAALGRGRTFKRSSKNHPVYAMKYFHGVYCHSATEDDALDTAQKDELQAYLDEWVAGITDGSTDHQWTLPDGTLVQDALVEIYVTHRDFRR